MRHFFVLFFDRESSLFLEKISRKIYASYCPGKKFPKIEHHLTIQYFQCDESHYDTLISETAEIVRQGLPVEVLVDSPVEYVNELNDFCTVSLQAKKKDGIMRLHSKLTRPLEKLYLNHEPLNEWPPHVTCFPGMSLDQRHKNWDNNIDFSLEKKRTLLGVQLRFTRWTGTYIETIHSFESSKFRC
ncbi:MAG: 2'-5' RNA ligase family protein [Candidatus Rifleibacteriota bacterium]